MKRITLDLPETDIKMILWALSETDRKWTEICETSEDEDVVSDYGNDLALLRLVEKDLRKKAVQAFGEHVVNFSREIY